MSPAPPVVTTPPATVDRRDVLVRPALAGVVAGTLVVVGTAVLSPGHHGGRGPLWSVAAAAVLVLAFSGLTGAVMTAVAGARPEMLLAVALASYVTKVTVFGVAAAAVSDAPGFTAPAFALGGTVTLLAWLVTEAVGVLRSPALRAETFRAPV